MEDISAMIADIERRAAAQDVKSAATRWNEAWFKACLEIIDRCVAPNMYRDARSMLDRALQEAQRSVGE